MKGPIKKHINADARETWHDYIYTYKYISYTYSPFPRLHSDSSTVLYIYRAKEASSSSATYQLILYIIIIKIYYYYTSYNNNNIRLYNSNIASTLYAILFFWGGGDAAYIMLEEGKKMQVSLNCRRRVDSITLLASYSFSSFFLAVADIGMVGVSHVKCHIYAQQQQQQKEDDLNGWQGPKEKRS